MPGFDFQHRLDGGQPTVKSFRFHQGDALAAGDMLSLVSGDVRLAATGDAGLLGIAMLFIMDRPVPGSARPH
jgi:hypothetical protein